VVGRNPSPFAVTFAYCYVNKEGEIVKAFSGFSEEHSTNNEAEFLALMLALEGLPTGWGGKVFSDSLTTLRRFLENSPCKGLDPDLRERGLEVLNKLSVCRFELVSGHPTKKELEAGFSVEGRKVSKFNVVCDDLCTREAQNYKAANGIN
jgi:ribonuclease HI